MELLVFGASGPIGRRVCEYAHSDGHAVTAFGDVEVPPGDVAVRGGDVRDPEAVGAAVEGVDAVCSALVPEGGLVEGTRTIVDAMVDRGVDRIVSVSAAAILQATPTRLRVETTLAASDDDAAAHRAVHETLEASPLDWTLACPPRVADGPPRNHYRTAVDYLPDGGQSISAGDVAGFVYEALVDGGYHRERVGIAY